MCHPHFSFFKNVGDFLIGGLQPNNTYNPPSWHQYSLLLRKTSATDGELVAYRDGARISTTALGKASTNWSYVSTTTDLILGTYKDTGVIKNLINTLNHSPKNIIASV